MKKLVIGTIVAAGLVTAGCGKKGSGERVGEKLDEAGKKIEDAVDKDGPIENAGEAVDEAAKDVKRKVD